jgi:hypothetical protein
MTRSNYGSLILSTDAFLFALAYQVPPVILGCLLRLVIPYPRLKAVVLFPGTFVHELLHLIVGLILNGKPVTFSLWPRKVGQRQWVLGAVGFTNLRWYNAAFIGMAPLLAIVLAMVMTPALIGWTLRMEDLQQWLIAAPILSMCLPSATDCKISLKSWPLLCLLSLFLLWQLYRY